EWLPRLTYSPRIDVMKISVIEDAEDPRIADFTDLTDVQLRSVKEPAQGLFIAEGAKVIARALRAGFAVRSVLTHERWVESLEAMLASVVANPEVYVADPAMLERITGFHVHRGALAAMQRPVLPDVASLVSDAATV